jgi:hypothetical protein
VAFADSPGNFAFALRLTSATPAQRSADASPFNMNFALVQWSAGSLLQILVPDELDAELFHQRTHARADQCIKLVLKPVERRV